MRRRELVTILGGSTAIGLSRTRAAGHVIGWISPESPGLLAQAEEVIE